MTAARVLEKSDVAILLAGDDADRIPYFLQAYETMSTKRKTPLHIICAGGHTAFSTSWPSQAEHMAQQLSAQGVPRDTITIENKSRDTIANIVYTAPLLTPTETVVSVLTSGYHRRRSERFAQRVFTSNKHVTAIGTPKISTLRGTINEFVVQTAVGIDTREIKPGHLPMWERYLREHHPFHAPYHGNEPQGTYALACRAAIPDFDATVARIRAAQR
jgi:hypothetical protein